MTPHPAQSNRLLRLGITPVILGCLLALAPSHQAHAQQGATTLDTACSVPEGENAGAIVRRVESRLNGNWALATRTLRQTIARQERLGQDSAPAEAYLGTLECLQGEVESGRHNDFLVAAGGKPRDPSAAAPAVPSTTAAAATPAAPTTPAITAPSVPSTPAVTAPAVTAPAVAAPAVGAPASLLPADSAAIQAPPTPAPPALAGTAPQSAAATLPLGSVSRSSVLPGTAASYGLDGAAPQPAIRPLGQSAQPQSTSAAAVQPPPPEPALNQTAAPPTPAPAAGPQPAPSTAPQPVPSVAAVTPAAPATGSNVGDPRFVGQACLYFTRPEFEVIRGRVFTNRYSSGAQVCYEGTLYRCQQGLWSGAGACSAGGPFDVSTLEAEPNR
ncbi:MAG: hypothetical protein AAFY02_00975 [Pseudomonadota bacterium]